jgi:hypothetical protein
MIVWMKKYLCNSVARLALSGALRVLDQHYYRLKRHDCGAGYLDGFQRIRDALWRLRLSLAGGDKARDTGAVQVKTLAVADGVLKRELVAAKLDNLSLIPVQERGKPLRYVKPGPHYLAGALAAYDVFREHHNITVNGRGFAVP